MKANARKSHLQKRNLYERSDLGSPNQSPWSKGSSPGQKENFNTPVKTNKNVERIFTSGQNLHQDSTAYCTHREHLVERLHLTASKFLFRTEEKDEHDSILHDSDDECPYDLRIQK